MEYDPAMDHTVVRQEGNYVISQHQQMLNSIVLHMERHNNQMLENLKKQMENESQVENKQPLDSCVSMQIQLNRLKSLMDSIFTGSAAEMSVVESTPFVKPPGGARISGMLNKEFSPIVRGNLRQSPSKSRIMTNGTIQRSLRRSRTDVNQSSRSNFSQNLELSRSILPSLTELSMADISSMLIKTGNADRLQDQVRE